MTAAEKRGDAAPRRPGTQGRPAFRGGLSPTVERMFGALVVESEAGGEASLPESDTEGAGQAGSR